MFTPICVHPNQNKGGFHPSGFMLHFLITAIPVPEYQLITVYLIYFFDHLSPPFGMCAE